ncbi:MAG: SDR family oxidoreductase [Alphaproteobacteria bacterium]|nr:SDR family oxidoreductase [Alphaproteobacteria bacterium]
MAEDTIKTVLVTGAAKRIGRAIADSLAAAGWAVAIHYHSSGEAAEAAAAAIRAAGGTAHAIAADLADPAAVDALLDAAAATVGPLTALINNASAFEKDGIDTLTRASWDQHMETNLWAPLALTKAFAAQLPAGAAGNVINLLDQRVFNLTPYFLSYTVSKSALWTLTQTLALALAPRIRVNAIGPGPTLPSPRQTQAEFDAQWARMPLGRGTTPEEIAAAVRYLLDAPAVTGQMLALDGGQHLGWAQPGGAPEPE